MVAISLLECATDNGNCEHTCNNIPGGHTCIPVIQDTCSIMMEEHVEVSTQYTLCYLSIIYDGILLV